MLLLSRFWAVTQSLVFMRADTALVLFATVQGCYDIDRTLVGIPSDSVPYLTLPLPCLALPYFVNHALQFCFLFKIFFLKKVLLFFSVLLDTFLFEKFHYIFYMFFTFHLYFHLLELYLCSSISFDSQTKGERQHHPKEEEWITTLLHSIVIQHWSSLIHFHLSYICSVFRVL